MSKVLFATVMGGYQFATKLENLLGDKLISMGHEVQYLICDAVIPSCQMLKISRVAPEALSFENQPFDFCATCVPEGIKSLSGKTIRRISEFLQKDDFRFASNLANSVSLDKLTNFEFMNTKVGMHAKAGAIRYFAKRSIESEINHELVLRKYVESSVLALSAIDKLYNTEGFDKLVINHGIYVPQGPLTEYARSRAHVVTWNPSYRDSTFIFSHHESYHYAMQSEGTDVWQQDLTPDEKIILLEYLQSRRSGKNDWIKFSDNQSGINSSTNFEINGKYEKVFVALTSVVWDAELHYQSRAFDSMFDWIDATVDFFSKHPDLALIVRVHPAEVLAPTRSRESVEEYLRAKYVNLPENIKIISAGDKTSTYSIIEKSDVILIYNTKTGIEAACMGKPVVVAGEAWIKGKGFSYDAYSPSEYKNELERSASNQLPVNLDLAQKYAFHFFFRRMIELDINVKESGGKLGTPISGGDIDPNAKVKARNLEIVTAAILDAKLSFHGTI
jgi:hypothetical protein